MFLVSIFGIYIIAHNMTQVLLIWIFMKEIVYVLRDSVRVFHPWMTVEPNALYIALCIQHMRM